MAKRLPKIIDAGCGPDEFAIAAHQLAFNQCKVGTDTQILIERKGKRDGQIIGRSPWLQSVHVDAHAALGDILEVTLVAAGPNSMTGALRQKVAA